MDACLDIHTDQVYLNEMIQHGITVVRNKIKLEDIARLKTEIDHIRKMVLAKIASMDRPLKIYSDITERQLNRLDFRCGFTSPLFDQIGDPIINLIKKMSPKINFKYYWGAIPSLAGAGPTDLHRDVYPMLNTSPGVDLDNVDIQLPPYYFTVLIPLVEITQENGPTEFIKGSHKKPVVNEKEEKIFSSLLSPGDIVIFEGRTLHRGCANKTKNERLIAYITFIADWYNDQTFAINDYLFPELAVKGR